jgi:hypothetical protein
MPTGLFPQPGNFAGRIVLQPGRKIRLLLAEITPSLQEEYKNLIMAAHMRVKAVMAPEASNGLEILRLGCEAARRKNGRNERKPARRMAKKSGPEGATNQ